MKNLEEYKEDFDATKNSLRIYGLYRNHSRETEIRDWQISFGKDFGSKFTKVATISYHHVSGKYVMDTDVLLSKETMIELMMTMDRDSFRLLRRKCQSAIKQNRRKKSNKDKIFKKSK